jgi:hypothetical protein
MWEEIMMGEMINSIKEFIVVIGCLKFQQEMEKEISALVGYEF